MLADRWQYEKSVLLVPQWRETLPPITVTIGSDDGPAQDLNGCAWLLKCVVDIVTAGKAVDRRSIAPDDIIWERVKCIMDETETAPYAWRSEKRHSARWGCNFLVGLGMYASATSLVRWCRNDAQAAAHNSMAQCFVCERVMTHSSSLGGGTRRMTAHCWAQGSSLWSS